MAKSFASQSDLTEKTETFTRLADGVYCLTAEGDPNAGVIIGDDSVMVIDARATPLLGQRLIERIRTVTDKPIRHVLLTHYHAVRVLGASAYGAEHVIASQPTFDLIRERGEQDYRSEVQRFPRLFQAAETIPGLTWPTLVFDTRMTLWLGHREVQLIQIGRGHTKGDTVAWLPQERILFSGDLVEAGAAPYCGDAYFTDWPETLDRIAALGAEAVLPGRGEAMTTAADASRAIDGTRAFLTTLWGRVREGVAAGWSLRQVYDTTYAAMEPEFGNWVIFEHCMPFNVSRAYDEARGVVDPRIWTAERDREMWAALSG